jgi:hypothetical protein
VSAPCQKCGTTAEHHTFPGGGRAVCPPGELKYRRTLKITSIHFVEITTAVKPNEKFHVSPAQRAEAITKAEVDPLRVDDVGVLLVQEVA